MRKLLAWAVSHPIISTFLAIVMTGIGVHFFADFLAETRWKAYCKTSQAHGVKIHSAEFIPPEIPDEVNFAALPMFRAIFTRGAKNPFDLDFPNVGRTPGFGRPVKDERLDWNVWRTHLKKAGLISRESENPVKDVLGALEHYSPQIAEWSEWRTRPRCRFPLNYSEGVRMQMPHLTMLRNAVDLFALRMRAHLALGDSTAAYTDFREGLQGVIGPEEEPGLMQGLVRMMNLFDLTEAVGEGLADRRWKDAELAAIDKDLAKVRIWSDCRLAISSERGFFNDVFDDLAKGWPWERSVLLNEYGMLGTKRWQAMLVTRRLVRESQWNQNQYFDAVLSQMTGEDISVISAMPAPLQPVDRGFFEEYSPPALEGTVSWYLPGAILRYFAADIRIRQTRLACALERYCLANGAFPVGLAELAPAYIPGIPTDIYSGQPMIYRRKSSGSFLLYSVGKNRVDDNGMIDPKKSTWSQLDDVWLFAPRLVEH